MKAERYFPSAELEESAYYKVTSDKFVMYGCMSHYSYHIQVTTERNHPKIEVLDFEATHAGMRDEVDFLVKHHETFEYISETDFDNAYLSVREQIDSHVYDASLKP